MESRVSSKRADRIALIHENYGYIERLNCFMDKIYHEQSKSAYKLKYEVVICSAKMK